MLDRRTTDDDARLYCVNHPNVETYLRCGKCERPICAKCRVSTPVGFRCFDCAQVSVLPTYAISPTYYARAVLFGLMAAGVAGVLMGFFPNFEFWAALIMGIAVPEAISLAANQKRGPGLQMVAIGCIIGGFAISRIIMEVFDTAFLQRFGSPEVFQGLPFLFNQYTIMWLAIAIFFAHRRLQ